MSNRHTIDHRLLAHGSRSKDADTASVKLILTRDDLSAIYGWSRYLKFNPSEDEEVWDDRDEHVAAKVRDELLRLSD